MARDADAPVPTRTTVTTSLTAELLFTANLVASDPAERAGVDWTWVEAQRAQLPTEVREFLPRLEGLWWPTMGLVDFLGTNGHLHDPRAFVEDLSALPIDRFLAGLLNQDFGPDRIRGFLDRPESIRDFLHELCEFSAGKPEALEAIFRDPEGHRRGLTALLLGSDTPLFRSAYNAWLPGARETARTLDRRLESEAPFAVIDAIRGKPTPGPRNFERITFVPSRAMGHRHIRSWTGNHLFFFFETATMDQVGPSEVGAELAEFLKILADKTRMDILRQLCCGPSYGKELATTLGLTTATVSRHLDQLKAAGLVKEERADSNNVKQVRFVPAVLDAQWARIRAFLTSP